MNKSQIDDRLAGLLGLSRMAADDWVEAVFDMIGGAFERGDEAWLLGLRIFGTRHRATRIGRNPRTKESEEVNALTMPTFRLGKLLNDAVDAGGGS